VHFAKAFVTDLLNSLMFQGTLLKNRFDTKVYVLKETLNTTQDNDFVALVSACT